MEFAKLEADEGPLRARAQAEITGSRFGPEVWLNATSQRSKPEEARQFGLIHARSCSFIDTDQGVPAAIIPGCAMLSASLLALRARLSAVRPKAVCSSSG